MARKRRWLPQRTTRRRREVRAERRGAKRAAEMLARQLALAPSAIGFDPGSPEGDFCAEAVWDGQTFVARVVEGEMS